MSQAWFADSAYAEDGKVSYALLRLPTNEFAALEPREIVGIPQYFHTSPDDPAIVEVWPKPQNGITIRVERLPSKPWPTTSW